MKQRHQNCKWIFFAMSYIIKTGKKQGGIFYGY